MSQRSRIKKLSTRFLESYRYGVILLVSFFIGLILYRSFVHSHEWFDVFYIPVLWGFLVYKWISAHLKVFKVEFDDDYLYVIKRSQDILIPLENIKDIEMKSLGGMWRVDLMYTDIIGDHFYFKPSLLYPLNYKSKDELVNLLWRKIEVAKTKKQDIQRNALTS